MARGMHFRASQSCTGTILAVLIVDELGLTILEFTTEIQ